MTLKGHFRSADGNVLGIDINEMEYRTPDRPGPDRGNGYNAGARVPYSMYYTGNLIKLRH